MPIYKLEENKIKTLTYTTFANENINEARDLQKFIINSIEVIETDLLVISSEFGDWIDSKRRIDILCIDKAANLVVIELKRTEDGGHMELQAIRYAAMVANMTFDKAVKTYSKYLQKNNITNKSSEEEILHFLEWNEINEDEFANDVRIILVSADFSKEITTSVLWLLERDLDIKCVRIRPQKDGDTLYFDIQQIIPLPESADYQVQLKEKAAEKRQARRESKRDYSKFDITINGKSFDNLNKRQTMIKIIRHCVEIGISPQTLMELTNNRKWIWVDKVCTTKEAFEAADIRNTKRYDSSRWFNADDELLINEGKTYAFSNQHGKGTYEFVCKLLEKFPNIVATIRRSDN